MNYLFHFLIPFDFCPLSFKRSQADSEGGCTAQGRIVWKSLPAQIAQRRARRLPILCPDFARLWDWTTGLVESPGKGPEKTQQSRAKDTSLARRTSLAGTVGTYQGHDRDGHKGPAMASKQG